jgi:DNA-binding NarL/FixJ family response regulator
MPVAKLTVALPDDTTAARRVSAALGPGFRCGASRRAADVAVQWGGPGLAERVRALREGLSPSHIVAVLPATDATSVRRALEAGVDAAVSDADLARDLPIAVRGAMAGLLVVPRSARHDLAPPALSHRERQVLAQLVEGRANAEIAAHLFLAESTVKSHLSGAFAKLGVRSRRDAVAMILDPGSDLGTLVLGPERAPARRFSRA